MFNLFRSGSTHKLEEKSPHKDTERSANPSLSPAPQSATTPSSTSGFSFLNGGGNSQQNNLFGGMNVNESPAPQAPASSGFSFMQGSEAEHSEQTQPTPSAFSFMQSDNHHEPKLGNPDVSTQQASSFSFIGESSSRPEQPHSSGFSFMSPSEDARDVPRHEPERRNSAQPEPVHDLKLTKVASTKQVKKKKKITRVGAGRDEDEEESGTTRRQSTMEIPSSHMQHDISHEKDNLSSVETASATTVTTHSLPDHIPDSGNINHMSTVSEATAIERNTQAEEISSLVPTEENGPVPISSFSFLQASVGGNDVLQETTRESSVAEDISGAINQPTSSIAVSEPSTSPRAPISSILEQFDKFTPAVGTKVEKEDKAKPAEKPIENPESTQFLLPPSLSTELKAVDDFLQSGFQGIRAKYLQSFSFQQALLNKLHSLAAQSTQLVEKISSLEAKQTALAQVEDFEQADAITIEIESAQQQVDRIQQERQLVMQQLQSLRETYAKEKQQMVEEIHSRLDALFVACNDTEVSVQSFTSKLDEYSQEETSRLSIEQQRVEMEKNHCEREQENLLKENQVIEDAIKNQVGDYYVKQEALEEQIAGVREEIKVLEEQLALKRTFEADLTKSLKQIESKINEARKKFDRQLQRIQERLDALQKSQRECQQEEEYLTKNRERVESILSNAKRLVSEAKFLVAQKLHEKTIIHTVLEDLQVYSEKYHGVDSETNGQSNLHSLPAVALESSWEAFDLLQSNSDAINPRVKVIRDEIIVTEQQLAKIRGLLTDIRIQFDAKVSKQKSLVDQIEQLEVTKKLHAANKRFKEAGATAKELKELTELKEKIESEITVQQEVITTHETDEEQKVLHLEQLEKDLATEQRREKELHMEKLTIRIVDVKKLLRKLSKAHDRLPRDDSADEVTKSIVKETIELYQSELQQLLTMREELCQQCDMAVPEDDIGPDEEEEVVMIATEVPEEEEKNKDDASPMEANTVEEPPVIEGNEIVMPEKSKEEVIEEPVLELNENVEEGTGEAIQQEINEAKDTTEEAEPVEEPSPPVEPEIDVEAIQKEIAEREAEMEAASEAEDYEKAQELFDVIEALKSKLP